MVKRFGEYIRTVGSLAKNFDELNSISIENVMETENWQKILVNYCNSPNSPKFFTTNVFYCMVLKIKSLLRAL